MLCMGNDNLESTREIGQNKIAAVIVSVYGYMYELAREKKHGEHLAMWGV